MKYVWTGMALLCHLGLLAQGGSLDLTLKLKNMEGGNMANVTITLIETSTSETVEMTTNAQGVAHTVITSGTKYSINFLDLKNYTFVEVPENGDRTQSKGITYVPKEYRATAETFNREGVAFKEINQNYNSRTEPTKEQSILGIQVVDQSKSPLGNISLVVVSVEQKAKYKATTNGAGWAYFMVPMGKRYELDVPGIEAYKQYKLPPSPYSVIEYSIMFVPTNIVEQADGDTVLQEFTSRDQPTSERIKMKVHVNTFEGEPLEGEAVFYDEQESDKVYMAKTNTNGDAYFLLPKNHVYMLHLTYEREIRPLNVQGTKGSIGQGEMSVRYRGTEVIRNFYRTTRRNAQGMVVEFMETPIEKQDRSSYAQKTDDGFELYFEGNGMVYSPLVEGGKLYSSHGFYSSLFSCFDAETGETVWTTRLGEGGASPASYHEGIILMITESCSIYGIEAGSGRLAWSKWLAPYVICSPSAANDCVYAVYENDATAKLNGDQFVLGCFNVKDGSIKWQKWIDREGLSSPVVAGNSVFITTLSGTLYEFNAETGDALNKKSMNAVSAPTVLDDKIFVARRDGEHGQSLAVLDRSNWHFEIAAAAGNYLPGAFDRMGDMAYLIPYEGSRPLIHEKLLYHTVDNVLYCRDLNGNRKWQKVLSGKPSEPGFAFATMPILVGNSIIVGTQSGSILSFNAKTGEQKQRIQVGVSVVNQPIVMDGFVYAGTNDGRLMVYDTGNKKYSGWPMWGRDGSHNTVVE